MMISIYKPMYIHMNAKRKWIHSIENPLECIFKKYYIFENQGLLHIMVELESIWVGSFETFWYDLNFF